VTSLSALSGGRIVLGVGAGGILGRVTEMGAPLLTSGAAVDAVEEGIVLIRELSGGGRSVPFEGRHRRVSRAESSPVPARLVSFEGRHYRVERAEPAPVAAPPVWTGSVGPKSLAATGRVADGWIPGHAADWLSERYRKSRPIIDEAAVAVGREPREIVTVFNLPGRITDRPLSAPRDVDGRWVGGSVDQWVEELTTAVVEHGAAGFMLFSPEGGTPAPEAVRRWAVEIAPAVRENARASG
jgi:alkanesulfonate monooxygenase SsuD/methylene tetrahydromethanopterin reductase-like flavin-dependent oxidoreductase (luciferase family)